MALGGKCSSLKAKKGVVNSENGLGFGCVRYTRCSSLGRKRVLITNIAEASSSPESASKTSPSKRQRSERNRMIALDLEERSSLEALPQDILIRILCGVNHEDLEQLIHVSKAIREATLIAKQSHFAYSTPTKTRAFRSSIDFVEDSGEMDDCETPNALKLKQMRACRVRRISGEKLAGISVALFASPKKGLFMEEE